MSDKPVNPRWERHVRGKGRFVANLDLGRTLHAAFVRSAVAHGQITEVDLTAAKAVPGVIAVFTASDFEGVVTPWQVQHAHFAHARSPHEFPLAVQRVRYVGEPIAIVVAETLLAAQESADAAQCHIESLPAIADPQSALLADAPVLHPTLHDDGGPANRHVVLGRPVRPDGDVSVSLALSRVAPQPMESRGMVAAFEAASGELTVHQSHQHPHQMQDIFARLLDIPEHRVRVACPDVGGAFGVKQQLYPDEMAVVCAAKRLGARIAYQTTRSESLLSDAQARDHHLTAAATFGADGRTIQRISLSDLCGIGAFPHFPRTSFAEAAVAGRLFGAPYAIAEIETSATLVFQNKPPLGHYRGVGHPVACLATEALMDAAARALNEDPVAFRLRHLHSARDAAPSRMAVCLRGVAERLKDAPRGVSSGQLYGVGVACLLEVTSGGPRYYGEGGVHIKVDETAQVRMEPSGVVRVASANTDQGQSADFAIAQIVAGVLNLPPGDVAVATGDSAAAPYGGGAFGSRGVSLGGRAARDGALRLRARLLAAAGRLIQRTPADLDLKGGAIVGADGAALMSLPELAAACHFKPYLFGDDFDPDLLVLGRFTQTAPSDEASAAFGAIVRIDPQTGAVTPERIVAVHEAGTIVDRDAVRAQVVGGAAQGLGQVLMEAVRFDLHGQPLTGSLMDYALPRADSVPPIDIVTLPADDDGFHPRGVGELGASGTPAALFNAINDALSLRSAHIETLPATPQSIWQALRNPPHTL